MQSIRNPLSMLLLALWLARGVGAGTSDPTFDRIRGLAGEWQGEFAWSGELEGSGKVKARYTVTGGGATVFEDLYHGSQTPDMTSVYHQHDGELRMTHYCAAGNQPRLAATEIGADRIRFDFLDITNLSDPASGHIRIAELTFVSLDRLRIRFHYVREGRTSIETIDLKRALESPSSTDSEQLER